MARATKKTKDASPIRTYQVLGPLRHDGEFYEGGDSVEMTEAEAAALIEGGTLGEVLPAASPAAAN